MQTHDIITNSFFDLESIHPSWRAIIISALNTMDQTYLHHLSQTEDWLPGSNAIFRAFSVPFEKVNYVLLGESPYPRKESANGYAFWDQAVKTLWSSTGLSKQVNRATSLRNIIKMLLIAEGLLDPKDTSQTAITNINKQSLIQTNDELFHHLLEKGFLLLNASLVLQSTPVKKDANVWKPFIHHLLRALNKKNKNIELILFGRIAHRLDQDIIDAFQHKLYAEHPYNLSFIQHPDVIEFFKPFHLLRKNTPQILI